MITSEQGFLFDLYYANTYLGEAYKELRGEVGEKETGRGKEGSK
jgi:hypothetical protein